MGRQQGLFLSVDLYSSPFKNKFPINYSGQFLKTAALVSLRVNLVQLK